MDIVTARRGHRVALASMVLAMLTAGPLAAQRPQDVATGVRASRESLEAALDRLENAARSRAYSPELRQRAREGAAALRVRLERGDFRPGDSILLQVEGQPTLSDSFVVNADRVLVLPEIGRVPMNGILRSELEAYLTVQISRFIRDPIVSASSFIRVSVIGEVGRPGFYLMSPDMPLPDALMLFGLTATSAVDEIEVVRGRRRLLEDEDLQVAIRDGVTLSELDIRSGDQVYVPSRPLRTVSTVDLVRNLGFVTTLIFTLNRVF